MTAILRGAFALAAPLGYVAALGAQAPTNPYQTPYTVKFTVAQPELMSDIDKGPRGDFQVESSIAYRDWYSPRVRAK